MGGAHFDRRAWDEVIPARPNCASRPTSPFQGEVIAHVARLVSTPSWFEDDSLRELLTMRASVSLAVRCSRFFLFEIAASPSRAAGHAPHPCGIHGEEG